MVSVSRRAVFGALGVGAVASGASAKPAPPEATEPLSEMFTLRSAEGREYGVSIGYPLPQDPDVALELKGRKPVPIYVTDRWTTFGLFTCITRYMRWGGELPPCVIVGIGYPDEFKGFTEDQRSFDLTPTDHPGADSQTKGKHGGGAQFRKFLIDVVQPEVRRRGDFDHENAVLAGHSFGGLFALDTLVNAPGAFRHHLAISPSIWFDDRIVLRQMTAALERGATFPGRLAVYIGEQEERISPPEVHMAANVLDLQRLIAKHRPQFAGPLAQVLPGHSHHTVVGPAATAGLRFLLSPPDRLAETY